MRRRIEVIERTFAANHASGVAIFVNTELCDLKELLGPPKEVVWAYQLLKRVGGDGSRRRWRRRRYYSVVLARAIVRARKKWNLERIGASEYRKSDRRSQK